METLTRLVSESLARHGFDRPLDYRRLQWSRWFRCESHHSLLSVPSKPGVFALAEEVADFGPGTTHVGTAASAVERCEASIPEHSVVPETQSSKPTAEARRMLAVTKFFEDDDMAFVLDRMLSYQSPMRERLASGRYFVRYVVIEDQSQRCSICAALNQWLVSSTEKISGIGAHFATSLEAEHTAVGPTGTAHVATGASPVPPKRSEAAQSTARKTLNPNHPATAPQPDPGAATNIHSPSPFPSGF